MGINLGGFATLLEKFIGELSTLFLTDPLAADVRIDAFVRSQIQVEQPQPPGGYYKKCGDAFWWPQTCSHRDAEAAAFHDALSEYQTNYYALRSQIIAQLIESLKKQDKAVLFEYSQQGQKRLVAQYNNMVAEVNKAGIIMQSISTFATTIPVIGTFVGIVLKLKKEAKVDPALCTRISTIPRDYMDKAGSNPDYLGMYFLYRTFNIFYEIQAEFERVKKGTVGYTFKAGDTAVSFSNPIVPVVAALVLVVILILIFRKR